MSLWSQVPRVLSRMGKLLRAPFNSPGSRDTARPPTSIAHTGLHATRDNLVRAIQLQFAGDNLRRATECLEIALRVLKGTRHFGPAFAAAGELERAADQTTSTSVRLGFVGAADARVHAALMSLHEEFACSPDFSKPIPPPIARFEAVADNIKGVVMKHQNPRRFVFVPMLIISFPEPPKGTSVYGVFSVDAVALQGGKAHFVKQDFLVYQPWDGDTKYYGGGGGSEPPRAICERFGPPHYGCDSSHAEPRDHWYGDEADRHARLPKEPEFRKLVDEAIEQARTLDVLRPE